MENQNQGDMANKMKAMLDPRNIGQTIRMFMALGQEESIQQFLEMADMSVEGPELLAVSPPIPLLTALFNFSAPSN